MVIPLSSSSSSTTITTARDSHNKLLVVATRLHLGNASAPPLTESLQATIRKFIEFCTQHELPSGLTLCQAVIAVDATPKFPNYDLVQAVQQAIDDHQVALLSSSNTEISKLQQQLVVVLPVTPWGMFVPALNALVVHALSPDIAADYILFVSAESCSSSERVLATLWQHMMTIKNKDNDASDDDETLVCGAVLPGHDYNPSSANDAVPQQQQQGGVQRELTGCTTPWNTMALWNLSKLALTGFLLVSDGVVDSQAYGVEEVVAIATLQSLLGPQHAVAKLIAIPGVTWDQDFGGDEQRRLWQEEKMKSKFTRAQRQLDLLNLKGYVYHY